MTSMKRIVPRLPDAKKKSLGDEQGSASLQQVRQLLPQAAADTGNGGVDGIEGIAVSIGENELAIARFQGKHVATIAGQLRRGRG